ncbi:hypothetical protein AYI70_g8111 [Smittium culicis]|uniref:Uncharacterized protein n=1 Tax=Smittium culicis TaxID=133412 RepID=A0A1R1XEB8_9FUNG|nr:hypothetical protein AYI70_g8781 [Smittium culicis]OMJ14077.1 hypothetical protein AYI70_g8111 [Smittium culicis]
MYNNFRDIDLSSPIEIDLNSILKYSEHKNRVRDSRRDELAAKINEQLVFRKEKNAFTDECEGPAATSDQGAETSTDKKSAQPIKSETGTKTGKNDEEAPSDTRRFKQKERDDLVNKEISKFVKEIDDLWVDVPNDKYTFLFDSLQDFTTPIAIPNSETAKKPSILDIDSKSTDELKELFKSQVLYIMRK